MRERLEEAAAEKATLRDEIAALHRVVRESDESHAEALHEMQQRETASQMEVKRLENDTRILRCEGLVLQRQLVGHKTSLQMAKNIHTLRLQSNPHIFNAVEDVHQPV